MKNMRYFIENSFEVLPVFFCVQVETIYSVKFNYRDAMLIPNNYWKLYFEEINSFLFKRNFLLESDNI